MKSEELLCINFFNNLIYFPVGKISFINMSLLQLLKDTHK